MGVRLVFLNVPAIIVGSCAIKKSVVKVLRCNFTGCANHSFSLAANDFITAHREVIKIGKKVISKFCFSVPRTKLCKFTDLAMVKSKDTRWSAIECDAD